VLRNIYRKSKTKVNADSETVLSVGTARLIRRARWICNDESVEGAERYTQGRACVSD